MEVQHMPELPEVETMKKTLNDLIVGKKIKKVTVSLPRIVQYPDDIQLFCKQLTSHSVIEVKRRGKFLRFLIGPFVLVSHLRMEGTYGLYNSDDPIDKHTHVIFHFFDQTELRYKDVRQFGTMHLYPTEEDFRSKPLNTLGLEPLDTRFTFDAFQRAIANRNVKIKVVLLNQKYIVGLGNIYVDEVLFHAQIHPEQTASCLSLIQLKNLYAAIVLILTKAVKAGGSSIKSYVNGQGKSGHFQHQLLIYGRKQQPCTRCCEPIQKSVVGGRGTHYCMRCQPLVVDRKHEHTQQKNFSV